MLYQIIEVMEELLRRPLQRYSFSWLIVISCLEGGYGNFYQSLLCVRVYQLWLINLQCSRRVIRDYRFPLRPSV